MDHPASWTFYPMRFMAMSNFDTIGYLSSQPIDTAAICRQTDNSTACDFGAYHLKPGNVAIELSNWSFGTALIDWYDRIKALQRTRVGGMPAAFRERRLKRNRVRLEWQIFRPDFFGTWVQIEADLRGPRVSKLRAQVEAMVASFRFEPAPTPLASGKAAADAIAAVAVQTLQWRDRTTYACFPPVGVAPVSVVMALPSGTLRKPLPVICSTAIQRTDIGFWRLKLVARWQAAADRRTGHETTIQWLYPDGRIAASIGIGSPPAPYCCV